MSSLAKVNRMLEIFWWSMTIVVVILVTVLSLMYGWDKWALYYVIAVLTALMALMRRFMARRLAKSEQHKAEQLKKKK